MTYIFANKYKFFRFPAYQLFDSQSYHYLSN